ncbi:hypothetical protein [Burkholderia pseudomallei]|uniref:hypothetical protein n=1 Tax=Burkholderia pseudomallei TaxID=28450 RepID=UPI0021F7E737|nr:hypothetical protein [Burkholderia pseudomallei]MCW0080576.1 hypothetical protein [Burkholderia pseudomallei]
MNEEFEGIKTIQIHAQTRYPIVSAYEFEFLKSETEIQRLLKPCTIYFIIQRPLLYFSNVRSGSGALTFDIKDGTDKPPLKCEFVPSMNGFCKEDEELEIQFEFYKKVPDAAPPFDDVAVFKLRDVAGKYLGWFSPNLILYRFFEGTLDVDVKGPIPAYLDYDVHYIGKAFSQDIWKRLTGHEKMQSILTREDALNSKNLRAPFEIALLMLDIDGFDEANVYPQFDFVLEDGADPIVYRFTFEENDPRFEEYNAPKLGPRALELTNEVEAMLVNTFRPKYNEILFENYPNISSGTRSAGYTQSTLFIEKMPVILRTASHTQGIVLPNRIT